MADGMQPQDGFVSRPDTRLINAQGEVVGDNSEPLCFECAGYPAGYYCTRCCRPTK